MNELEQMATVADRDAAALAPARAGAPDALAGPAGRAGAATSEATAVLEVRGLVKRYGSRMALDGVGFRVEQGEFVALLGPNGAGKSTLFQILTGLFAADDGDAFVLGHAVSKAPVAALRHIGVVFQQASLDLDMSVERNLMFHADLHGLPRALARERIAAGCAEVGLGEERGRLTRELSGGNRRKVELVRALLHRPRLLLMDEATVGLDPRSRRDLLAALREDLRQRGSAVLWATHLVAEAEQADRVLVLHRGGLLAAGTPDAVAAGLGGSSLEDGFIAATGGA